ncbi:condensation domain-containing protein [Streptomyces celluloflavus]|uniref:non-ribosomal peptide synthetase n=1 Tax=Streptomyces celluloflavus TaxID=58344 RepID=UPI0034614395|nr:non-ribosomal peptide synthetase [Streptomyces celluloflavus]
MHTHHPGIGTDTRTAPAAASITAQYRARYRRAAEGAGEPADLLPVTGAQRRFLLARRLAPGGRPDVVPLFFAFPRAAVDLDRLRAAAGYLAAVHPALRARPGVLRGTPVQRLAAPEAQVSRVRPRPGESGADALRRALAAWSAEGPPLRCFLADDPAAGEPTELLALALDHVACDEQSLGRLSADLGVAYRDRLGPGDAPAALVAEEAAGYREAVHQQLAAEERASTPRSLAYWAQRLAAARPDGAAAQDAGAAPSGAQPPRPTGAAQVRLPAGAHDGRAMVFPVLLDACAGIARALHGTDPYGMERVPLLGYPWGGRPAAAPPVLGCFLNTVVHPALPGAGADAWWDDLDHADTPFDEVVRAARTAGAAWSGALDGLLTFEDLHRRPPLALGDAAGREIHVDGRPLQAPFAVSVSYGTELLVRMAWDRDAVSDARAEDAFAGLTRLLRDRLNAAAAAG